MVIPVTDLKGGFLLSSSMTTKRGAMSIVRILGSLYFAVFLITVLVVVLTVSTTLESLYGTPFAQKYFYQSAWFDAFLALVGVNILCSTLLRLPFKRQHTGFVVTHIGILMVLAGSLLSRFLGVDGNMLLAEGETKNEIVLAGDRLTVHHGGHAAWLDLDNTSPARLRRGFDLSDTEKISIDKIWTDAVVVTDILPGPQDSPANPAVEVTLSSEAMAFKETFWLIQKNPLDSSSDKVSLGPAVIRLKEKKEGKKSFINAGIYLFQKEVFSLIPSHVRYSLEHDLFPTLVDQKFYGYVTQEKLIDIGTPERYEQAKRILHHKDTM